MDWMSRLSLEDVDFDRGADEPRTICACDTFDGDSLADCSGVSRMGGVHYRMSCDIAADALQFPVRALNEVLFDADYDLALLPVGVTLPDGAGAAGLETFEEALRQVASGMVGVDGQPSFYESTYREYFDACRPTQCSWVAAETQGAASLVATLLGLFGGLVIVLRVSVPRTSALTNLTSLRFTFAPTTGPGKRHCGLHLPLRAQGRAGPPRNGGERGTRGRSARPCASHRAGQQRRWRRRFNAAVMRPHSAQIIHRAGQPHMCGTHTLRPANPRRAATRRPPPTSRTERRRS